MSLYLEWAARAFDAAAAEPFDAGGAEPSDAPATASADDRPSDDAATDARPVDGEALATLVANRPSLLAHPTDDERFRLPLHDPTSGELTGACVDLVDHPLRGPVFVYREDGAEATAEAADVGATPIGPRVRFWSPDAAPDERPSYVGDGPTPSTDPVRRPESAPEDYLDALTDRLDDERAAIRDRNRERARHHSPGELRADGVDAVPHVEGVAWTPEGLLRVHAVPPDGDTHGDVRDRFGLFEGDEVLVHGGPDAPSTFPAPATVRRFARFQVDLALRESADEAAVRRYVTSAPDDVFGLSLLLNPVTYDRQRAAIGAVRHDERRLELLAGRRAARFRGRVGPGTTPRDDALDPSQAFAATCACYAEDVCCIHGPPGTGKTRVLLEVVRRAVDGGERVLVAADSNQAVDNLLVGEGAPGDPDPHSLHARAAAGEFRVSRHRAGNSDRELVRREYGGGAGDEVAGADVVAATDSGAAEFDVGAFDLAVVDEATQATAASTLVPFTRADRAVLAGDHWQLPPFEPGVDVPADRYHSLFERLYAPEGIFGSRIGVRLDTQYRMHEAIAAFPSERFYGGDLATGRAVEPIDGLPPLVGVDVAGEETVDETESRANEREADAVAAVVDRLLEAGVAPDDAAVITPYDAQASAVRDALGSRAGGVAVDTVDAFQGSEREAVVVSFVRSNDRGDLGFLARQGDGPRRLNVALTRAERFCALVGDWSTLRAPDAEPDVAELYAALYDHLADRDLLVDDPASIASAGARDGGTARP